jgi:hypothetical protein
MKKYSYICNERLARQLAGRFRIEINEKERVKK